VNPEQLKIFSAIEQQHWWFVARRQIIARLIAHVLPPNNGRTILDIGCGTGGNLGAIQEQYRCVGVDASPTAIELARKQHPRIRFVCSPAEEELHRLASEADMILMMDVLEHVADDFLFLSKIAAAVEPKAYLLLTVPADMSLWSKHDETVLHFRRYDEKRFRAVWDGLPLETRLLSRFNTRLYGAVKLTRWINRWRGRSLGGGGMDFVLPTPPINRLLTKIFGGETKRLLKELDGGRKSSRPGVSLLALLQRHPGPISTRTKPADVYPDAYSPEGQQIETSASL
jgi:SAM-dependent methyltransferase